MISPKTRPIMEIIRPVCPRPSIDLPSLDITANIMPRAAAGIEKPDMININDMMPAVIEAS